MAAHPSSPPPSRSAGSWLGSWGPVALYCAVIFGLSSISNVPTLPTGSDKLAHLVLYSGLGFLVARAASASRSPRLARHVILVTVLFCAAYGLSDETHQLFVPRREFDLKDLAADAAGAALGAVAWWLWSIIGPVSMISARSRRDGPGA